MLAETAYPSLQLPSLLGSTSGRNHSSGDSRPCTSSCLNVGGSPLHFPTSHGRRPGVHTTPSQTAEKLGLYSSYKSGDAGSGRLLGSYGYTSSWHNTGLIPSTAPRAHDSQLTNFGARISSTDMAYLVENGRKNAEVFGSWKKNKDQQMSKSKAQKAS